METILLLPYHGAGHFNPFLSVASDLSRLGYRCVFSGSPYFKDYLANYPYPYHVLRSLPFASNFERWINTVEGKKNPYLAELADRYRERLYYWRKRELDELIETVAPSIIILDAMLGTDFIVIYEHLREKKIRFVVVHTMIPPQIESHRPPATSLLLPNQTKRMKNAVIRIKISMIFRKLFRMLKFVGMSDELLLKRRTKMNGIPQRYFAPEYSHLKLPLNNVTQLVLTPKEFDFPGLNERYIYAGFTKALHRQDIAAHTYVERRSAILTRKSESGRKLVYCSFGTIMPKDITSVYTLVLNLISVCATRYLLVISIRDFEFPASDNLFIFSNVDQPDVLGYCDVFVTHGGLNSISEAIQQEVPLLTIPVHENLDTQGNAARVLYHKLGVVASPTELPESIAEKLEFLLSSQTIKDNLLRIKQANQKYQGKISDIICNANTL